MAWIDIFRKSANDKLVEHVAKQNDELLKIIRMKDGEAIGSKNMAGGIPNTAWNSGDLTEAFGFPQQFAITAKRMDNTAVCSNILNYYSALIGSFNWTLKYKDEALNNDPVHKAHLEFLAQQFNRIGGIDYFVQNAVRQMLKYGLCVVDPTFRLKLSKVNGKKRETVPVIEDIALLDPQNILAFYAYPDNYNKVSAMRYLSQPVGTYDPATKDEASGNAMSVLIDFANTMACICTLDNAGGDPLGVSFLKDIWGDWRVLNNINTSVNQNLITVGEHSYMFAANQNYQDSPDIRNAVLKDIEAFINGGGGVFFSPYGTLEKVEGMDLQKYQEYIKVSDTNLARRKGLNIEVLGSISGASKNLAEFAQADALMRAKSIARQFSHQFSEGFIRTYFEKVFYARFFSDALVDTPILEFEVGEGTPATIGQPKEAPASGEANTAGESPKPAKEFKGIDLSATLVNEEAVIVQDTSGNKTWIKSEANDFEAVVLDTASLDRVLQKSEAQLADYYVSKMREHVSNPHTIERLIEKPTDIINKRTLDKAAEIDFIDGLNSVLATSIGGFLSDEADRLERAFILQGKTFDISMRATKAQWVDKLKSKILASKAIKDFGNSQLAGFTAELDSTLVNERRFVSSLIESDKGAGYARVTQDLANLQGRNFAKLAPVGVINLFQSVNESVIASTENKGLSLIRSGVLERQCEHCQSLMGIEYKWDGNNWVSDSGEPYYTLPDSKCAGGDRCRCFYVQLPMEQVREYIKIKAGD